MDFFDRAYVINLPQRTDRRAEITRELKKADMPLEAGKVELVTAIRPEVAFPFKSIGAKGAFLSHLKVLKMAKAANLKNVLIIEDDLQFTPDFKAYETALITELASQDWDLVQFGYCTRGHNPNCELGAPLLQDFAGENTGAHCYAVNGKVLKQLIHFLEALLKDAIRHKRSAMSIDGAFNVFKWRNAEANRLITTRCFASQRSSASDISTCWFDQTPGLRQAARVARKVPGVSPVVRFARRQGLAPIKQWLGTAAKLIQSAQSTQPVPPHQGIAPQPSNCHSIG
ncbi:MAG: glycosyltransferase family 25 protein [Spirulinaceae cyanobacterium]